MATFAVMDGNVVINTIFAESLSIAENITGKTCMEYTSENPADINGTYNSSKRKFIKKSPYPSWVLNSSDEWEPPVGYPAEGKNYVWSESTTSWVESEAN